MYLIIRKDTYEFFTGYQPRPPKPEFYHSPMIARKYQSKLNAKGKIQDMRAAYTHELSGAKLEVVEQEIEHRNGRFFTYYLFEDFLIIHRPDYVADREDWKEIMDSRQSHEARWHDVMVEDDSNGIAHLIPPNEIGGLTEAPIIGFDIERNRDGTAKIYDDSYVYWFPEYMITDEFEKLARDDFVVFQRVEIVTKPTADEDEK